MPQTPTRVCPAAHFWRSWLASNRTVYSDPEQYPIRIFRPKPKAPDPFWIPLLSLRSFVARSARVLASELHKCRRYREGPSAPRTHHLPHQPSFYRRGVIGHDRKPAPEHCSPHRQQPERERRPPLRGVRRTRVKIGPGRSPRPLCGGAVLARSDRSPAPRCVRCYGRWSCRRSLSYEWASPRRFVARGSVTPTHL